MATDYFYFSIKNFVLLFGVYEYFACVHVWALGVCSGAPASHHRALNALGLELQVVMSHRVVVGDRTLVLWDNTQYSYVLSYCSSPCGH